MANVLNIINGHMNEYKITLKWYHALCQISSWNTQDFKFCFHQALFSKYQKQDALAYPAGTTSEY